MSLLRRLLRARRKLFWLLAVGTLALDQLSKLALWSHPREGRPAVVVIPHVLRLISHEGNLRGALGLGPATPLFYVVAALIGLAVILGFVFTTEPDRALPHVALGLLAGGAVGNLIDRAALGFVRDFIDLHWGESLHWHTFNVADAAICAGFVLVLYDAFFGVRGPEDGPDEAPGAAP